MSSLLKRIEEFEYAALMGALERQEVPEAAAQDYLTMKEELRRREELHRQSCTRANFPAALEAVLAVIAERRLGKLVLRLAQGAEHWDQSAEVRINPKNPFFKEIVLRRLMAGDADTVKAAIFVPGGTLPLAWVRELFPDLAMSAEAWPGEPLVYEVLRIAKDQAGRIEFVSSSEAYDPDAHVTAIRISCW